MQGAVSRSCEFVKEFADADQHGTLLLQSAMHCNSLPFHSRAILFEVREAQQVKEANFSCPVINPRVLMIVSLYKTNVAQVKNKVN